MHSPCNSAHVMVDQKGEKKIGVPGWVSHSSLFILSTHLVRRYGVTHSEEGVLFYRKSLTGMLMGLSEYPGDFKYSLVDKVRHHIFQQR